MFALMEHFLQISALLCLMAFATKWRQLLMPKSPME
jgi:hypothetical protein